MPLYALSPISRTPPPHPLSFFRKHGTQTLIKWSSQGNEVLYYFCMHTKEVFLKEEQRNIKLLQRKLRQKYLDL